MIERPHPDEYYEYYGRYIDQVPEGDVCSILADQLQITLDVLDSVPGDREDFAYAPDKWSFKEVIGHVTDAERVFAYRALSFARRDPGPLPSMEENEWARVSNAAQRTLAELADEFAAVRRATIALFNGFDDEMLRLRGTASGYEFSVRAIAYIIAGHELHHRGVLEQRYLEWRAPSSPPARSS